MCGKTARRDLRRDRPVTAGPTSTEVDYPIVVGEAVVVVVIEGGKNREFRNHTHLADRN